MSLNDLLPVFKSNHLICLGKLFRIYEARTAFEIFQIHQNYLRSLCSTGDGCSGQCPEVGGSNPATVKFLYLAMA